MPDDPERSFSEGRFVVTDQRCAMRDSTLEVIMSMRQWMRHLGTASFGQFNFMLEIGLIGLTEALVLHTPKPESTPKPKATPKPRATPNPKSTPNEKVQIK